MSIWPAPGNLSIKTIIFSIFLIVSNRFYWLNLLMHLCHDTERRADYAKAGQKPREISLDSPFPRTSVGMTTIIKK
jgi:hypothetical protein